MRLICPNCDAQYEVDDAVIPDAGRDVQCSNCGHTWFQRPAHLDEDLAEDLAGDLAGESGREVAEKAAPEPETEDVEQARQPKRRGLDPQVADVLREEAQREAEVRRAEASGLETQGDLGLDDGTERATDRTAAARARMARLRGLDDDGSEAAAAAAASGSRRELLPDIEEINSTLRASDDRETPDDAAAESTAPDAPEKRRSGFRRGFGLSMLAVAAVVLLYSFAPQIIKAVPQTEPYLTAYVEWANGMRGRLNSGVDKAIDGISGLVGGLTGGDT